MSNLASKPRQAPQPRNISELPRRFTQLKAQIPPPQIAARATAPDLRTLSTRLRGEFLEMPGLRLTTAQAARLAGVPVAEAAHALRELVDGGVLRLTASGYLLA
jgi:hypothetical protein